MSDWNAKALLQVLLLLRAPFIDTAARAIY
jgi:hypothetical protein